MRKNLVIMLLFIIVISLFAQDKTTDVNKNIINQKAIEFSIGGDIIFSNTILKYENFYTEVSGRQYDFKAGNIPLFTPELSIPISFVFYPNPFFGIGIMNQFGFACFVSSIYLNLVDPLLFIDRIKFINKFGGLKMNNWFLLEYGININHGFNLVSPNVYIGGIFLGPSLFLGYETLKNNFEFTAGFDFNTTYYYQGYNVNPSIIEKYVIYQNWYFGFGIECRLKFAYLYKFKNNTKTMPTSDNSR